jgi:hypothetical protein
VDEAAAEALVDRIYNPPPEPDPSAEEAPAEEASAESDAL